MKFERLPSVNLAWHDPKLQHRSSDIVGIEEPFRLKIGQLDSARLKQDLLVVPWATKFCSFNFRKWLMIHKNVKLNSLRKLATTYGGIVNSGQ